MGKQTGQSVNSATSPPAPAIRRARASSRSNPRAPSTTLRTARLPRAKFYVASPIPLLAPVMTTTLSLMPGMKSCFPVWRHYCARSLPFKHIVTSIRRAPPVTEYQMFRRDPIPFPPEYGAVADAPVQKVRTDPFSPGVQRRVTRNQASLRRRRSSILMIPDGSSEKRFSFRAVYVRLYRQTVQQQEREGKHENKIVRRRACCERGHDCSSEPRRFSRSERGISQRRSCTQCPGGSRSDASRRCFIVPLDADAVTRQ